LRSLEVKKKISVLRSSAEIENFLLDIKRSW
jgi:hypothetical protein